MEFWEILYSSIYLIFSFDKDLLEIIILSLKTSGFATIIASFLGLITGYTLAIYNFRSKDFIIILLASLMGIPPVTVGLIVYFIFVESGPLGIFSLLFTPTVMIIAQFIIVYPIISTLIRELFEEFWIKYKDPIRSFNISTLGRIYTFFKNNSYFIFSIFLAGFGRAISEVGAVMIVGGNIEHYTRVMTTSISLETRMGNLQKAMSLGIILLLITIIINVLVFKLNKRKKFD